MSKIELSMPEGPLTIYCATVYFVQPEALDRSNFFLAMGRELIVQ